jgi:serine/threonine-protein kinase
MSRCVTFRAALVALLVAWPTPSRAGDTALAEALFREGKTLLGAGDYEHACPKLEESFRQDPATGTLLALAACQERSGKVASAWATYTDVAARSHQEGRTDREKVARDHAEALAPRLSRLTLEVSPELRKLAGFSLKRDGAVVPDAAYGSAVPIDPGEHALEATATGKKRYEQKFSIGKEPTQKKLSIPPLEDDPNAVAVAAAVPVAVAAPPVATEPPAAEPAAPTAPPPPSEPASQGGFPFRTVGLLAGGVGIAAFGVATVFAFKAKGLDDDSNAEGHCDATGCDERGTELRNDAIHAGNVATGFLVGGAVLVGGGAALYFLSPAPGGSQAARLRFTPSVAPGSARLELSGAF